MMGLGPVQVLEWYLKRILVELFEDMPRANRTETKQ
jgi:hypothetical protein